MEAKKGTLSALFKTKWLPACNTQRTNCKTLFEVIPYFSQYVNYMKAFSKGQKPDFIPTNKILTKKDRQYNERKKNWKNPIMEAQSYLDCLESNPDFSYKDVAEKFKISKARVSQMISLLTKLPYEIIDCLKNENIPESPPLFAERKLRPLSLMKTDNEKIGAFNGMFFG